MMDESAPKLSPDALLDPWNVVERRSKLWPVNRQNLLRRCVILVYEKYVVHCDDFMRFWTV